MHLLHLGIGEQIDILEIPESVHVGHVHIRGIAAVERPFGVPAVHLLDLVRQRAGDQVEGPVGPARRVRMIAQRQGGQTQTAVGPHVPVVQVNGGQRHIAGIQRLVQTDLLGDKAQFDLQNYDAFAEAGGLLGQDAANLLEGGFIVLDKTVDHVVGHRVQGHHFPLVVRFPQIPSPGRELHVLEDFHRPLGKGLIVGHQVGESQALGEPGL